MFKVPCKVLCAAALVCCTAAMGRAGSFPPAAGYAGATAISASSAGFAEWATGATINRGLVQIDNPSLGFADYGGSSGTLIKNGATTISPNAAPLGEPPLPASTFYGVALGQGGTATLTFPEPIANGPGPDLAVFGNGFTVSSTASWIKPAFVEVSSDGIHFFPFPAVSLTSTGSQLFSGGTLNPTNLYDLAGKDPAGWGTPFDLSELAGVYSLLDVNDITAVRIVDCVDDINPTYASRDSQGNVINGPWPAQSAVGSEGFVLAGVGAINVVPEPGTLALAVASIAGGALALRRARQRTIGVRNR